MELAREAGLPVSWWEKANDNSDQREWRELKQFAQLIALECVQLGNEEFWRYSNYENREACAVVDD